MLYFQEPFRRFFFRRSQTIRPSDPPPASNFAFRVPFLVLSTSLSPIATIKKFHRLFSFLSNPSLRKYLQEEVQECLRSPQPSPHPSRVSRPPPSPPRLKEISPCAPITSISSATALPAIPSTTGSSPNSSSSPNPPSPNRAANPK